MMIIQKIGDKYDLKTLNKRAEDLISNRTDEGEKRDFLDIPIFKLISNETAEEMGLNGSGQQLYNDDDRRSIANLLNDL